MAMSEAMRSAWIGAAAAVIGALIGAGATWLAKPDSEPPQRAVQRAALKSYANLTEVIRKYSLTYARTYPSKLAELQRSGVSEEDAGKRLREELRQSIHTEGDLLKTTAEMRVAFPDLKIDQQDWDQVITLGRAQYNEYLAAVHKAATSNADPTGDTTVTTLREAYLAKRNHIVNVCVAGMY